MCDCEKHFKRRKPCTCICDEHANFKAARELAFVRYGIIQNLIADVERLQAKLDKVRELHPSDRHPTRPNCTHENCLEVYGDTWSSSPYPCPTIQALEEE